jgi:hypothetical protein
MPRKSGGKPPHSKNADIFNDYDFTYGWTEIENLI